MAESQQFSHNIFQSDPLRFKSYINKKVSVLTEDGNTQTGIVYTVDPVSERLGFQLFISLINILIII